MQGFVDTQGQLARVAVQPGQDEILIGGLVGNAIASAGTSSIRSALDEGVVTQQAAKDLIEALAPVRATDPFHYGDTPAREFEAMEATLRRAATRKHGWRGLLENMGVPADQLERRGLAGPRELLDSLPSVRPLYDLYGQALREIDPAKARALLAKADALAAGLNPPADTFRLLLPSFERVLEVRDRFNLDLASLMQTLEAIAADPAAASRRTAPAVLWARVAARVGALPDETQAAIEALRSGAPDLPTADRDRALACLHGCDATIFEAMRIAAACERKDLDFSKVRGIDAWPPLPTFGGLRGAAPGWKLPSPASIVATRSDSAPRCPPSDPWCPRACDRLTTIRNDSTATCDVATPSGSWPRESSSGSCTRPSSVRAPSSRSTISFRPNVSSARRAPAMPSASCCRVARSAKRRGGMAPRAATRWPRSRSSRSAIPPPTRPRRRPPSARSTPR
jgi:hypothetical protein